MYFLLLVLLNDRLFFLFLKEIFFHLFFFKSCFVTFVLFAVIIIIAVLLPRFFFLLLRRLSFSFLLLRFFWIKTKWKDDVPYEHISLYCLVDMQEVTAYKLWQLCTVVVVRLYVCSAQVREKKYPHVSLACVIV